jgi:hypothetical protein
MNCRECEQLIQRLLDGDADIADQEDLAGHLAICADCHDLDTAAQYLLHGLRLLDPPQPPAGLLERICENIRAERVRVARWRRLLVRSAVAASLLLTGSMVYFAARTDSRSKVPPALVALPGRPAPETSTSLHRRIEEASLAVVALTRRTADETVGQTKLLLPVSIPRPTVDDSQKRARGGVDPHRGDSVDAPPGSTRRLASREGDDLDMVFAQALEPPARSLREIQEGMAAGLEPLASSARRAVGFFLREIPPAESRMQ